MSSPSPGSDLFGGSSHVNNPMGVHQEAVSDIVGLDFN